MSNRGIIKEQNQRNVGNSNPQEVDDWRELEIYYEPELDEPLDLNDENYLTDRMKRRLQLKLKGAFKGETPKRHDQRLNRSSRTRALQENLLDSMIEAPIIRDHQREQDYRRHLNLMTRDVRRLRRETSDPGHLYLLKEIRKKIIFEEELH